MPPGPKSHNWDWVPFSFPLHDDAYWGEIKHSLDQGYNVIIGNGSRNWQSLPCTNQSPGDRIIGGAITPHTGSSSSSSNRGNINIFGNTPGNMVHWEQGPKDQLIIICANLDSTLPGPHSHTLSQVRELVVYI